MPRQRSLARWILVQVVILFVVLIAAEGIMRLFDLGVPSASEISVTLLTSSEENGVVHLRPKYAELDNPEIGELIPLADGNVFKVLSPMHDFDVVVPRPKNVFRVVLLGSSAAFGLGETPPLAGLLRDELEYRRVTKNHEIVDLSNRGMTLEQFRLLTPDALALDPSVVVVMLNGAWPMLAQPQLAPRPEWVENLLSVLQRSRLLRTIWQTLSPKPAHAQEATKRFLPKPFELSDSFELARTRHMVELRENMRRLRREQILAIAEPLRAAGVPVLFVGVFSDLVNLPPVISLHLRPLPEEEMSRFIHHYHTGNTQTDDGDCAGAVEHYKQAAKISPTYAMLHYRLGKCLLELGKEQAAREAFIEARRFDLSPERASMSPARDPVDEIKATGADYLDIEFALHHARDGGVLGQAFFKNVDHFNALGQAKVARVIAVRLVKLSEKQQAGNP